MKTTKSWMRAGLVSLGICTLLMAALMAVPVLAENAASGEMNLFAEKHTGQRTDFTGNVGFEFTPADALSVTALGRSVSGGALQLAHLVTLWDPVTEKQLAQGSVSSASKVDERGFAFERLPVPLKLEQGCSYRLSSGEEAGGDPMMEIGNIRALKRRFTVLYPRD